MIEHLVVSTLVLLAAIAAARLLPLTARTRHALLVCGLAKFALPSEPLARFLRLARIEPSLPSPLRVFGGASTPAVATGPAMDWLVPAYAAIAALILGRWLLLRARTVRAALRVSSPASDREVRALAAAIRATGVRTAIDIVRSSVFEAPAVLRVIRPVIVIPDCDALDDDQLRALLCHECAHVARRDNLLALFTAAAGAALWFHPLVWLALRDLSTAREKACDERVAEVTGFHETYIQALVTICSNAIAPRPAGVSCMANAHLKERMEHLMNYDRLKQSALSHRIVLTTAIIAVLAITTLAASPAKKDDPYRVTMSVKEHSNTREFTFRVIDVASGELILTPHFTARPDEDFRARSGRTIGEDDIDAFVQIDAQRGMAVVDISRNRAKVQHTELPFAGTTSGPWSGAPISVNLRDADLRDVLHTFGDLTGLTLVIEPGVTGKVTVDFVDVPWDRALDLIARQNGLTIRVEGKVIHVSR